MAQQLLPTDDLLSTFETAAAIPVVAVEPPRTGRDVQRGALRDLISLAADVAASESEVEREYRTAKDRSSKGFGDRNIDVTQQHQKDHEELIQKHQDRLAELTAQYKSQRNKIAIADKAGKQKIEGERHSIEEKLKAKYDQAAWLADSVLEVANGQAAAAFMQTRKQVETAQEDLNGFEVQSAQLIQKYGVPLPTDAVAIVEDPTIVTDADAAFAKYRAVIEQHVTRLNKMPLANLFVGGRPYLLAIILAILTAAWVQFSHGDPLVPQWQPLAIFVGGVLAVLLIAGIVLRIMATKQVRTEHTPVRSSLVLARQAVEQQLLNATEKRKLEQQTAQSARNAELQAAKDQIAPFLAKAMQTRTAGLTAVQAESAKQLARIDKLRDTAKAEADESIRRHQHELDHKREKDLRDNKLTGTEREKAIEDNYRQRKAELTQRWTDGLAQIQAPIDRDGEGVPVTSDWSDPFWQTWKPSKKFASRVRFGEMHVDLKQIAENVPQKLDLPATFSLPAVLAFPAQASLLIHTDQAGRPEALRTLQMVMARLLTSLPAGRVRFTIIDPVGLGQNFAGFMHLADYDDALVGGRIWTSTEQIDTKLTNLAEHMETVIQKYLRNEFSTIDDYNAPGRRVGRTLSLFGDRRLAH